MIRDLIKDIIVDALSCAADNAHDMGVENCNAYAVGVITLEIICGESYDVIDCGYFDRPELNDREILRGECRPRLNAAIIEFINIK